MANILEPLIRLQELEFVQSEHEILEDHAGPSALEREIQALEARLPTAHSALFRRLRARYLAAVVPLHHGACSACGVAAPTSQAGRVRAGRELEQCRSCGRILYQPDHLPEQHRGLPHHSSGSSGPARFSRPSLMFPEVRSDCRDGALAEIVDKMAAEGLIDDAPRVLSLALDRENLASTALSDGLAFPHVRGIEGGGMVFGLGLSREGVVFDAASERRTFIIVFTMVPAAASSLYLGLVADLIRSLADESASTQLRACTTEAALWRAFSSLSDQRGQKTTGSRR